MDKVYIYALVMFLFFYFVVVPCLQYYKEKDKKILREKLENILKLH
jgi:hypothetical protein